MPENFENKKEDEKEKTPPFIFIDEEANARAKEEKEERAKDREQKKENKWNIWRKNL